MKVKFLFPPIGMLYTDTFFIVIISLWLVPIGMLYLLVED